MSARPVGGPPVWGPGPRRAAPVLGAARAPAGKLESRRDDMSRSLGAGRAATSIAWRARLIERDQPVHRGLAAVGVDLLGIDSDHAVNAVGVGRSVTQRVAGVWP
jgi:hypothetical protein